MKNKTLLIKLIKSTLIISAAPLIIFVILTITTLHNYMNSQEMEYNFKVNSLVTNSFNEFEQRLYNLCYGITLDSIAEIFQEATKNQSSDSIRPRIKLHYYISQQIIFTYLNTIVKNLMVTDTNGNILYDYSGKYIAGEQLDYALDINSNSPYFTNFKEHALYKTTQTISYVRKMNLPSIGSSFIIIDIDLNHLSNIFDVFLTDDSSSIFLCNDKQIIFKSDDSLLEDELENYVSLLDDKDYIETKIQNKKFIISKYQTNISKIMIFTLSQADFQSEQKLLQIYIISFIISISLSIILAVLINKHTVYPIKQLQKSMEEVTNGDLNPLVPDLGEDEIGQLANCFRLLLKKINTLITENYKVCIQQKNAQIKALQTQINPHFLYNTLETIDSIAAYHHIPEISEISLCMSKMYRYSIKDGSTIVTIRDELMHLHNYINIIKIRFENKIDFIFSVDDHALDMPCLKFVFQPIVENAVIHAFQNSDTNNRINISIQCFDKHNQIIIRDNGCGINGETLDNINKSLSSGDEFSNHIGLANVHERIQTIFGKEYGVHITSGSYGTTVEIHLPLKNANKLP